MKKELVVISGGDSLDGVLVVGGVVAQYISYQSVREKNIFFEYRNTRFVISYDN